MPILNDPSIWLKENFIRSGLNEGIAYFLSTTALIFMVAVLAWLSNILAKALIKNIVSRIVSRTPSKWDDIFMEQKVFTRMSHLAPALIIWFMAGWALKDYPIWLSSVHKLTYIYMVVICSVVMISFINAWHEIYKMLPISQHRHIKGYVQLLKIFVITIAALILISVVFKQNISSIIAGLGAMAAVILLIFKDTILGLVASIQLSGNEMLRIGDWITIPGREVDGNVIDITLNTVKIQNFDKTIITVPTYALVNESFQNWKGMEDSKIRQIKRSIMIDMKSIKFVDGELRQKLMKSDSLREYINSFENQTGLQDKKHSDDPFLDRSLVTNLGVFRHYAETYLKKHPLVDNGQVIILRHKQADGNGLPLQIYMFSRGCQMVPYENLQSEVFEHMIAMLSEFELKVFQHPTGYDVLSSNDRIDFKS
jgi:miniconductance mechanosensitive channel